MGTTPWGAIAQGAIGLGQTIGGYIQQRKATKKLENLANTYQPNQSIMDYYTKALAKYNVNPYTSPAYKYATQKAQQGLTTGMNYLQDRKSALAGVGSLVQGYNDTALKAAATAEGQQSQALGQLGQAAGMKTQEERYPFELKYNLLAAKAAGGGQVMNAGIGNAYGGASSYSQMQMLKKLYGDSSGTKRKRSGGYSGYTSGHAPDPDSYGEP